MAISLWLFPVSPFIYGLRWLFDCFGLESQGKADRISLATHEGVPHLTPLTKTMDTMDSPQANVVPVLSERVANLRQEGKHDEAIRVATTAIDTAGRLVEADESARPHFVSALETLAELRLEQGDYPPAEALLIDALDHAGYCEVPPIQMARMKSSLAGIYDFNALRDAGSFRYSA